MEHGSDAATILCSTLKSRRERDLGQAWAAWRKAALCQSAVASAGLDLGVIRFSWKHLAPQMHARVVLGAEAKAQPWQTLMESRHGGA